MAKPATRIVFLEVVLALAGMVILARSFVVQVVQHNVWEAAEKKRREGNVEIRPRRGRIFDRNGKLLAASEEQYRVSIALNEVRDTAALQGRLPAALGLPRSKIDAAFRGEYPSFYGPFNADQVEVIRRLKGVHLEPVYNRIYPMQSLADRILGRLNQSGTSGIEGMEKTLDTLLQGRAGLEHFEIDAKGTRLATPGEPLVAPVAGHDVYLTLDSDLQDIAEGALRQAVAANNAHGGDIVVMYIDTGELLAVASVRPDSATHQLVSTSSALVEPNEPGSTSKLFTAAAILRTGRDTTPVNGEGGHWAQQIGHSVRNIYDVHKLSGPVTLGETIEHSSNIAISKFALRLTPEEQFTTIRDFGFGTAPGLGFPGEASGRLTLPARWANPEYTKPSLGQGYEWEASAVQLAVGYCAIANHGFLMAPSLVRSVHDERDSATWEHRADTVRRAVPDSVAHRLMEYLMLVADSGGTGAKAQLARFHIPGKTGTARVDKKFGQGYRASFVGIFPENHPQVVIYVMIDRPGRGEIFGGEVAAPIVATILQQALATVNSPLDRSSLVARVGNLPARRVAVLPVEATRTVRLPVVSTANVSARVPVPTVAGQSSREAIVALERAGFQVRLVGRSQVRSTLPAAGDSLARGSLVTVYADSVK